MSDGASTGATDAGQRVGLFLCRCGTNLGRIVGVDGLGSGARWPQAGLVAVHDLLCGDAGLAFLKERIRADRLDRVVVAACSPREHGATFRGAVEAAGLSPWHLLLVNLREQVEWLGGDPDEATDRAERLIRAGLARVALQRDLPRREVEGSPDVVVIGGGPAGLAAARALAGRDRRAAIVERTHALGGLANRLDELSGGGACASCVLAPAIDDVLHHEAIEVLTGAEVTAVRGAVGGFDVDVALSPRFVDPERCLGCPACVEACPVERPDAAEAGFGLRRAMSYAYAGCLPWVPAIDASTCAGLGGGSCRACVDACPVDAVRLDDRPRARRLHAGAIVVAVGAAPGEVGDAPGLLSTWRLERLLHPNGPTAGQVRGASGEAPADVVLALGEGGAADGALAVDVLLKQAGVLRRRFPLARVRIAGEAARSPLHAPQLRVLAEAGVELLADDWLGVASEKREGKVGARLRAAERERTEWIDLLVLHAPSRPAEGSGALAALLRVAAGPRGFLDDGGASLFEPTSTRIAGVFVAGAAAGPRPLRAAIRDGAAAAGRILSELRPGGRLVVEPLAPEVDAERCCGCAACSVSCAFGAILRDPATGKAAVEPLHCRGCGSCAAACPTGAMGAPHQTRAQIAAEVSALLAPRGSP